MARIHKVERFCRMKNTDSEAEQFLQRAKTAAPAALIEHEGQFHPDRLSLSGHVATRHGECVAVWSAGYGGNCYPRIIEATCHHPGHPELLLCRRVRPWVYFAYKNNNMFGGSIDIDRNSIEFSEGNDRDFTPDSNSPDLRLDLLNSNAFAKFIASKAEATIAYHALLGSFVHDSGSLETEWGSNREIAYLICQVRAENESYLEYFATGGDSSAWQDQALRQRLLAEFHEMLATLGWHPIHHSEVASMRDILRVKSAEKLGITLID